MNQESEPIKISKDSDKISLEDAINAVTPQFSSSYFRQNLSKIKHLKLYT